MKYLIVDPSRYFTERLPQKRMFYANMLKVLDEHGIPHETIKAIPKEYDKRDCKIIAYHTKNREYYNVKIGHIPDWMYFDRYGYNGWSEYGVTRPEGFKKLSQAYVDHRFWAIKRYITTNQITKLPQNKYRQVPHACEPFLFVALQMLQDSTNQLMSFTWEGVLRELKKTPYKIIIKRHPNCKSPEIAKMLGDFVDGKKFVLSSASIHKLIPASVGVVTGNSGVGFESLIYQKPVFLYGHSDYKWVCYNNLYGDRIKKVMNSFGPEQEQLIRKFVVDFLDNFLVDSRDSWAIRRKLEMLGVL